MNSKGKKIIATILIIAFLTSASMSGLAASTPNYNQKNGVANVNTGKANISVTGGLQVPFFHIQLNNSKTSYLVKFSSIQRFVDLNKDGKVQPNEISPASSTPLPGLNWMFSGFQLSNNNNTINFNFTTKTTKNTTIELNVHVDTTQGNSLKFDLIVQNYDWQSDNPSARLAIKFQIAGGNLTQSKSNSNDLHFGNAQFNTVSTASSPEGNINIATQIDSGSSFYLLINHFNNSFELDPTFSVSPSSSTPGFEVFALISGFTVIGVIVSLRRRKE